MRELAQLMADARDADPSSRILLRDPIAAHGDAAVEPMAAWLTDDRLGPFAVRVLQRIALDAALRPRVVRSLASIDRNQVSSAVRGDIDVALAVLRPPKAAPGTKSAGSSSRQGPPERRVGGTVEERFHDAMLEIYWTAGDATGYWASYFLRAVRAKGGLATARDLLARSGTSPGFARLKAERCLHLSMEALVIDPEFTGLFTTHEVEMARERLEREGFDAAAEPRL